MELMFCIYVLYKHLPSSFISSFKRYSHNYLKTSKPYINHILITLHILWGERAHKENTVIVEG